MITDTDFGDLVLNPGNTMMPCFLKWTISISVRKKETKIAAMTFSWWAQNNRKFSINWRFPDWNNRFFLRYWIYVYRHFKDRARSLKLVLEVFPSKLDYYKDYQELIMEINEEVVSLAFKFLDKTYLAGKLIDTDHQINAEFLNILDIIFNDLETALKGL